MLYSTNAFRVVKDFHTRDLTLCSNADSAHTSNVTKAWTKQYYLPILALLGGSSDLSIFESLANSLKELSTLKHTYRIKLNQLDFGVFFNQNIDQTKINSMYNWYTDRLEACKEAKDQMTKY